MLYYTYTYTIYGLPYFCSYLDQAPGAWKVNFAVTLNDENKPQASGSSWDPSDTLMNGLMGLICGFV